MRDLKRSTHHRRTSRKTQMRLLFSALILISIMVIFWYNIKEYRTLQEEKKLVDNKDYLPQPNQGTIYHKPYFSLSYVEKYELPEWVSYRLTADMLERNKYPRDQDFNPDPAIEDGSAHYHDYKKSGWRRGHLVPAGDMSWNKEAMDATFLLSNIAPMKEEFNDGIWLELENNVRDWARKYGEVIVVVGPVFSEPVTTIGGNEVLVPKYYYKAVFAIKGNEPLVAGFLFDQTNSAGEELHEYIVSIDSLEKLTELELFENMYGSWDKEIEKEKSVKLVESEWAIKK